MQRHDQSEQHLAEQRRQLDDHDSRLDTVERGEAERQKRAEQRLEALERARWPLPSLAAVVALHLVGVAVSLWTVVTR
ncbi:hypothetical protein [Streptomyces tardus]|uniref:hypothetical protein n=1 Tax=Streptomyces tardus TaxID=2780544 RepID=UPI0027E4865E|nr:hypothetical protein [Streptomyces tardus]